MVQLPTEKILQNVPRQESVTAAIEYVNVLVPGVMNDPPQDGEGVGGGLLPETLKRRFEPATFAVQCLSHLVHTIV